MTPTKALIFLLTTYVYKTLFGNEYPPTTEQLADTNNAVDTGKVKRVSKAGTSLVVGSGQGEGELSLPPRVAFFGYFLGKARK